MIEVDEMKYHSDVDVDVYFRKKKKNGDVVGAKNKDAEI